MKPFPEIDNLTFTQCHYGDHHLQRLGVWTSTAAASGEVPGEKPSSSGYWIVFIHGGAWRDPRNSYQDFVPSIKAIQGSSDISTNAIRGYASIDYRLSPHPSFPQDPAETPKHELRAAQHPDHLCDVRSALAYLDKEYGMGQDYILMGHSAGGTLVYQVLMGEAALTGIYDLNGLVTRFGDLYDGVYRKFITGAFGSNEELWKTASPVYYPGKFSWPGGKIAMLAWSPADTLIDEPEIDNMGRKMKSDDVRTTVIKDLTGDHEVVWEKGDQIARLVAEALGHIKES